MLSGELGTLAFAAGAVTIRDWDVSHKADLPDFVNAGTKGGTGRRVGTKDWSGSFSCDGHTPPLIPGQTGAFIGALDASKGASGSIIVDETTIKWDIEAGKIIENSTKFSGSGVLTLGAVTPVAVTEVPDPVTSVGCKALLGATEILQIRTMELTLKRANQGGAHSGSAGWMQRRRGPLDATVAISIYCDDPSAPPQPGAEDELKLYVGAATFWALKNMLFGELSGLKVDVKTHALIGATLNAAFNGFLAGATVGHIKNPATTALWPEA